MAGRDACPTTTLPRTKRIGSLPKELAPFAVYSNKSFCRRPSQTISGRRGRIFFVVPYGQVQHHARADLRISRRTLALAGTETRPTVITLLREAIGHLSRARLPRETRSLFLWGRSAQKSVPALWNSTLRTRRRQNSTCRPV